MENNENTVDKTTEQEEETSEEEKNETEEKGSEKKDETDWQAEATKWKAIAERNKNKKLNDKNESKSVSSDITREELVLIAKGMSEEDINQASIIAKGSGKTLKEAVESDLFKSWKATNEANAKSEQAQLGASKGSGTQSNSGWEGLTDEEHKKKFIKEIAKK